MTSGLSWRQIICLICHLLDPSHFEVDDCDHTQAVNDVSQVLSRDGFRVSYVANEACIEHEPTGARATKPIEKTRPLNPAERKRREDLLRFLGEANEDEFTEHVVVPLSSQYLGYSPVTIKGHRDKSLKFGKNLWRAIGQRSVKRLLSTFRRLLASLGSPHMMLSASYMLVQAAWVRALLQGRDYVVPKDIIFPVIPVCAYRVITQNYMHDTDGIIASQIMQ